MKASKRVLFLTEISPLDCSFGGGQRTHFIWKALCELCADVETIIPVPSRSMEGYDESHSIRRICFERKYSLGWFLLRVNRRMFKRFMMPGISSKRRIACYYPAGFDCVVVRYTALAARFLAWQIAPMVLDVDDLPTESFATNWRLRKGLLYALGCSWLKSWQNYVFTHAMSLCVANKANVVELPNSCRVFVLPNIPRMDHPNYANYVSRERYVFWLGTLAGQSDDVGVDYVLNHYWKEIQKRFPGLIFKVAGPHLPKKYKEKWSRTPNVEVLGFVDDVDALYRDARAMLAPISAGAGTAIKVLECLSYGRVCIGTPFAWRGCDDIDSVAAIRYENGSELIDAFEHVMDDNWLANAQRVAACEREGGHSYKYLRECVARAVDHLDVCGGE